MLLAINLYELHYNRSKMRAYSSPSRNQSTLRKPTGFSLIRFIIKHPIKRYNTIPYMLKGMMTCGECGRGLTAYTKRGKHIYYRCTSFKRNCTQIGVKEDIIVPQLDTFMEQIHIPSDIVEYLKTS